MEILLTRTGRNKRRQQRLAGGGPQPRRATVDRTPVVGARNSVPVIGPSDKDALSRPGARCRQSQNPKATARKFRKAARLWTAREGGQPGCDHRRRPTGITAIGRVDELDGTASDPENVDGPIVSDRNRWCERVEGQRRTNWLCTKTFPCRPTVSSASECKVGPIIPRNIDVPIISAASIPITGCPLLVVGPNRVRVNEIRSAPRPAAVTRPIHGNSERLKRTAMPGKRQRDEITVAGIVPGNHRIGDARPLL